MTRPWRSVTARLLKSAALVLGAALAGSAHASSPDQDNPEDNVVSELVVVAPAEGPAWWKATKGDSVVWILGLPPSRTPKNLDWSRKTLNRRLKGARVVLAPYTESSGFRQGVSAPSLPGKLADKVSAASLRLGEPRVGTPTVATAMRLRFLAYQHAGFGDVKEEILAAARLARVPIVTPPVTRHVWTRAQASPANPQVAACIEAITEDVAIPAERHRKAAAAWAVGDVKTAVAIGPMGVQWACRPFWPGHWERTVDFQTSFIAQALERPGKVVALVTTRQLVAEDGVLQRLRARGYTIADPAQPLSE